MPVSRKSKKNLSKKRKNIKSRSKKTRKHIRKMKGGDKLYTYEVFQRQFGGKLDSLIGKHVKFSERISENEVIDLDGKIISVSNREPDNYQFNITLNKNILTKLPNKYKEHHRAHDSIPIDYYQIYIIQD